MTIKTLESKIKNNRKSFIKALKAAGYTNKVVNNYAFNSSELLRLAVGIYDDVWETFDRVAFEKAIA